MSKWKRSEKSPGFVKCLLRFVKVCVMRRKLSAHRPNYIASVFRYLSGWMKLIRDLKLVNS